MLLRNSLTVLALTAVASNGADKGFVVYNTPPAVTISTPLEGEIFEHGEPVYFTGQVVDDSDVTGLTVEWTSSLNGVLPDADPPSPDGLVEFVSTALDEGIHVITLRAIDGANEQGEATVTIEIGEAVLPVEEPIINIISPAAGIQGIDGEDFTFAVNVDDADDPPSALTVELTSSITGFVCFMVPDASGNGTCAAQLPLGQHLLTFQVTDSDGFSANANAVFEVVDRGDADLDQDGHTPNGGDCNDSAPTIHPGAPEICDGLDNDCDPNTEIDVNSPCFDDDLDGFCEVPPCTNADSFIPDCDDANPNIHPDADEVQNQIFDDDCDGLIDEGFPNFDDDGDGYCEAPPCTNATNTQQDCDDEDGQINPGAPEVCGDGGIDNNCNGLGNEPNAIGCSIFFEDIDQDGYGNQTGANGCYCDNSQYPYTADNTNDCDDASAAVHPGQTSWFSAPRSNGSFDYNCDGQQEPQYTAFGQCNSSFVSCDGVDGWLGNIPQCGQSGQFVGECDEDWGAFLLSCVSCYLACCGGSCTSSPTCVSCAQGSCAGGMICNQGNGGISLQTCR